MSTVFLTDSLAPLVAAEAGPASAEVMPAAPAAPCQLYVHVPFCEVLCPFCSFHRVRYNPSKTGRYFEALRTAELSVSSSRFRPPTRTARSTNWTG